MARGAGPQILRVERGAGGRAPEEGTTVVTRRRFLKTALASAPVIASAKALGLEGPGANEQVKVGLIGLGGRCKDVAKTCQGIPGMRIAAVCDCFEPRISVFLRAMEKEGAWKGYTDFREMIEKEKLDAVMVETTTHARAWVACQAMAMGMDTYIEKPMCLTIAEGRHMVNVARKYGRVTQVGTQQRSMPLNNWASDQVKNGALGKIDHVLAPNFVGPNRWEAKPGEELPPGATAEAWDIWTNQAEFRPYRNELFRGWATWWDYDGGGRTFGVTGWGTHSYDQIQRGLGTDETGPVEVLLEEEVRDMGTGKFEPREPSPDETGAGYYGMAKNTVGPRAKVKMTYADGVELRLHLDGDWGPGLGCIFVCENGKMEINRDHIASDPKELAQSAEAPPRLDVPETQPHIENWLDCIKTRERCTADIEYGQRSSALCYLVNIARDVGRVGEGLKWDPDAERFTNSDEGNALLSRPRREGYELPA
ncbi:MAG: Gfo/Idh/MocA family oxidoreductase [Candidatus Hydrogenedentes bacterium]|nr:Gfo/Idh/MocA family oxidoreductase [Candidatus Hydrogenedentota bacterium]